MTFSLANVAIALLSVLIFVAVTLADRTFLSF